MRPMVEYKGRMDYFKNHCAREGVTAGSVYHYARYNELDNFTALEILIHKRTNKPAPAVDMSKALPGLSYRVVMMRISRGWSAERALNTPVKSGAMDMTGAADGVSPALYSLRISRGWSHDNAMQTPALQKRARR